MARTLLRSRSARPDAERSFRDSRADECVIAKAWAATGTASYEVVNTGSINVGGVGNWTCPQGMWLHTDNRSCVMSAGCRVPGIPDQDLKGGYFFWKGDLYRPFGQATWTCKR